MSEQTIPAGWYPLQDGTQERYYDGTAWTAHVRDAPVPEPTVPVAPASPATTARSSVEPGWYPNADGTQERFHDGSAWTDSIRPRAANEPTVEPVEQTPDHAPSHRAPQTPESVPQTQTIPAGWYPLQGGTQERYYDGTAWTAHVREVNRFAAMQSPQPVFEPAGQTSTHMAQSVVPIEVSQQAAAGGRSPLAAGRSAHGEDEGLLTRIMNGSMPGGFWGVVAIIVVAIIIGYLLVHLLLG